MAPSRALLKAQGSVAFLQAHAKGQVEHIAFLATEVWDKLFNLR